MEWLLEPVPVLIIAAGCFIGFVVTLAFALAGAAKETLEEAREVVRAAEEEPDPLLILLPGEHGQIMVRDARTQRERAGLQ